MSESLNAEIIIVEKKNKNKFENRMQKYGRYNTDTIHYDTYFQPRRILKFCVNILSLKTKS